MGKGLFCSWGSCSLVTVLWARVPLDTAHHPQEQQHCMVPLPLSITLPACKGGGVHVARGHGKTKVVAMLCCRLCMEPHRCLYFLHLGVQGASWRNKDVHKTVAKATEEKGCVVSYLHSMRSWTQVCGRQPTFVAKGPEGRLTPLLSFFFCFVLVWFPASSLLQRPPS